MISAAVVSKNKSRSVGEDFKHSAHFIVEVCGVPTTQLNKVVDMVLGDSVEKLKDKTFESFRGDVEGKDDIGQHPEFAFDRQTAQGRTGFSMPFSRKKARDPDSEMVGRAVYKNGELCVFDISLQALNPKPFYPPPVDGQHRLADLDDEQAVWLMYQGACSVFKTYCAQLSGTGLQKIKTQQSRTAARRPAVSGGPPARGGPRSSGTVPLPEWCRSYLDRTQGYTERMRSAEQYAKQLSNLYLPEVDPAHYPLEWHAGHYDMGCMPCPTRLSFQDGPEVHRHSGNGIIIATTPASPNDIFTRCTECIRYTPTNPFCERVKNKMGGDTVWIRFNEENFKNLIESVGMCALPFVFLCVCVYV